MEKNLQWWLVKIDRAGAWLLMLSVVLFFATSYGMEKGIFNPDIARFLHTEILPAAGIMGFMMHTNLAVRMALMRWRLWNKTTKTALIIVYLVIAGSFTYYTYIYQTPVIIPVESGKTAPDINLVNPIGAEAESRDTNTETQPQTQPIFTAQELAQYNGKNGAKAYVAIDGLVYDVSNLFVNGRHHGCLAGKDVTAGFFTQHLKSMLAGYPVVGTYKSTQ